jgi:hypothetical protein
MTTTCLSAKEVEAELCAEKLEPGTQAYRLALANRFEPVDPNEERYHCKLYYRRPAPQVPPSS